MDPWPVYREFAGLFEQLEHAPALVPVQDLRYLPTPQSAAQLVHEKPLPAEWLHLPVLYFPVVHVWFEQLLHLPSS